MNNNDNNKISRRKFFGASAAIVGTGLIKPDQILASQSNSAIDKTEKKKELGYKIAVCDWMILKRQKLSALKRTHEIGADGIELDMGGLGNRDTFDNKLLDPIFRRQYKEELEKFQIEISSIAMSGFYAQSFPERETYKLMVRDCINCMDMMNVKIAFLPLGVKGDLVKYPDLRPVIVERFKVVAEMAEASGVIIGIETALDAEGEVKLLEDIGSKSIQIYLKLHELLSDATMVFALSAV